MLRTTDNPIPQVGLEPSARVERAGMRESSAARLRFFPRFMAKTGEID